MIVLPSIKIGSYLLYRRFMVCWFIAKLNVVEVYEVRAQKQYKPPTSSEKGSELRMQRTRNLPVSWKGMGHVVRSGRIEILQHKPGTVRGKRKSNAKSKL